MLSYQSLEKSLSLNKTLPVTEHWSAAPDFLKTISDYCLVNKPATIVECSSGTSSLVLSQCCKLNKTGHVYSLESGQKYASQTRQQLDDLSLSEYCDVIHAPLQQQRVNDKNYQWYTLSQLPEIEIDMLVIDGPPGFLQKHSRYPALPLLNRLLAKKCVVFLDDAAREDEQALVKCWLEQFSSFRSEYINNERGCFILNR